MSKKTNQKINLQHSILAIVCLIFSLGIFVACANINSFTNDTHENTVDYGLYEVENYGISSYIQEIETFADDDIDTNRTRSFHESFDWIDYLISHGVDTRPDHDGRIVDDMVLGIPSAEGIKEMFGFDLDSFHIPVDVSYTISTIDRLRDLEKWVEAHEARLLLDEIQWLFPLVLANEFYYIDSGYLMLIPASWHDFVREFYGLDYGEFLINLNIYVTRSISEYDVEELLHFVVNNLKGSSAQHITISIFIDEWIEVYNPFVKPQL